MDNTEEFDLEFILPTLGFSDDELKNLKEETQTEEHQEEEIDETGLKTEYERHYNVLKEKGYLYLPEDYTFDGDVEKMYELHMEQLEKEYMEDFINQIPQEAKDIMRYVLNGGKDIKSFVNAEQDSNIKINTKEEQISFITNVLKEKGLDDLVIKSTISGLDVDDKIEEAAKKYAESIKENSSKQKEIMLRQQEELKVKNAEAAKLFAKNINEEITKQPWDPAIKTEIQEAIYNKVPEKSINTKLATIQQNPAHLVQLAMLLNKYDKEKGFNLQEIGNTDTKVIKEVKDSISKIFNKNPSTSNYPIRPKEKDIDWSKYSLTPF